MYNRVFNLLHYISSGTYEKTVLDGKLGIGNKHGINWMMKIMGKFDCFI